MDNSKALKNALRDLKRFQQAERITTGKEREKYQQGIDNLKRYILKLKGH